MSSVKSKIEQSSDLKTKLALTRISRWHGLTADSIAHVRRELMSSLGLHNEFTSDTLERSQTTFIDAPTPSTLLDCTTGTTTASNTDDQIDHQIRHLLRASAPWHVIYSVLWKNYQSGPTLIKAARILETAFVEASPSETLEIFVRLMTSGQKGFYWYLHPRLRDFIIEHAPQQYLDQLYWTIAKERDDEKLTGIEMTYIFLRVATSSDKTAAWMYFRRHQDRILSSFSRPRHFGMTRQQLVFRAGELALSLGYSVDAKELFLKLPQGSTERETALQLMLRFDSSTADREKNSYLLRLEAAQSWEERLSLISGFCDATRKLGSGIDPNRAALDQILKSLLKWVPKKPESWRMAGELLIKNRDLLEFLPSMFHPLMDQSIIFHGPDIDGALWSAAYAIKPRSPKERLLSALASLHKYVTNPRLGEDILWASFTAIKSLEGVQITLPWSWRDLTKAAKQWITDSTILPERDRKRASAALRLASEGSLASKESVEMYASYCVGLPDHLSVAIAKNAIASGNSEFALTMLIRLGLRRPFTNHQLIQMWNLATQGRTPDLAWRIATVLQSREVLPDFIKTTWDISGENRSSYQPVILTPKDIELALTDLSTNTKKLILALCKLGGKINELITISEPSIQTTPTLAGSSITERAITEALKNAEVLSKTPKIVSELISIHTLPEQVTSFAQAMIHSPWLFAFRSLAERLSITSWGWSFDMLEQSARAVLPLIGRSSAVRASAKVTKWLSSLTSTERSAWNDLIICSKESDPDKLTTEMVKFLCRLSTILYPSHLNALKSTQQLRPHLEILRDLEWFIVSDALTSARSRHGISTQIVVPESLRKALIHQ